MKIGLKTLILTLKFMKKNNNNKTLENMKRIIITMLVVLVALTSVNAMAAHRHEHKSAKKDAIEQASKQSTPAAVVADSSKTDNEVITKEKVSIGEKGVVIQKDGKKVEIKFGDLGRIISKHLDDTLLNSSGIVIDADDEGSVDIDDEGYVDVESQKWREEGIKVAHEGMDLARDIASYFAWALVAIVFLSLLFYFLHRSRKYKTVDRAIMNNYPLPNEFYGKRTSRAPQPTTVYINQVVPNTDGTAAPAAPAAMNTPNGNPLNNITDWAPYKNGFTTTAVGLCLMLFFLILGSQAMAALMLIIVFIGMWKLFTTYQEQMSIKQYWQQQQWYRQAQQQAPVPPMPQQQEPIFHQQEGQNNVPPLPNNNA